MGVSKELLIMGIDPGSYCTGFGLIKVLNGGSDLLLVNHGAIILERDSLFFDRLYDLGNTLEELFQRYSPDHIVVEKIFLGRNADSAFKLGHIRGVILYHAMKSKGQIFEYSPRAIKQGVTGSGAASKEQVKQVVEKMLKIPMNKNQKQEVSRLDAFDALAMALFHSYLRPPQRLLEIL